MPQWNFSYSVCGVRIIVQLSHDVPDKAFSKHMMPWNGIISTAMLGNVLGEYLHWEFTLACAMFFLGINKVLVNLIECSVYKVDESIFLCFQIA